MRILMSFITEVFSMTSRQIILICHIIVIILLIHLSETLPCAQLWHMETQVASADASHRRDRKQYHYSKRHWLVLGVRHAALVVQEAVHSDKLRDLDMRVETACPCPPHCRRAGSERARHLLRQPSVGAAAAPDCEEAAANALAAGCRAAGPLSPLPVARCCLICLLPGCIIIILLLLLLLCDERCTLALATTFTARDIRVALPQLSEAFFLAGLPPLLFTRRSQHVKLTTLQTKRPTRMAAATPPAPLAHTVQHCRRQRAAAIPGHAVLGHGARSAAGHRSSGL
jgi:hypothetical protein